MVKNNFDVVISIWWEIPVILGDEKLIKEASNPRPS